MKPYMPECLAAVSRYQKYIPTLSTDVREKTYARMEDWDKYAHFDLRRRCDWQLIRRFVGGGGLRRISVRTGQKIGGLVAGRSAVPVYKEKY